MRTAIISDIHGNLDALRAVLRDGAAGECRRTICLGDLFDGGPADHEIVRELMDRNIPTVRGNCDDPGRADGSLAGDFLQNLRPAIVEADIAYTHITPCRLQRRIRDRFEAWDAFEQSPHRLAFIGHTHIPLVFRRGSDPAGPAKPEHFDYNRPIRLNPADRYIICVGAVGHGRDGIAAPRYAIFDDTRHTLELRRVEIPALAV
jgi:predicted phosphodiesterase